MAGEALGLDLDRHTCERVARCVYPIFPGKNIWPLGFGSPNERRSKIEVHLFFR